MGTRDVGAKSNHGRRQRNVGRKTPSQVGRASCELEDDTLDPPHGKRTGHATRVWYPSRAPGTLSRYELMLSPVWASFDNLAFSYDVTGELKVFLSLVKNYSTGEYRRLPGIAMQTIHNDFHDFESAHAGGG